MIRFDRKLIVTLICLVILGRSQGSAGFCMHHHDHFPSEHHQHECAADETVFTSDVHDNHVEAECCCQKSSGECDDCMHVSLLVDTTPNKNTPTSTTPETGQAGSDCDGHTLVRLRRLTTYPSPNLTSLRTVILLV